MLTKINNSMGDIIISSDAIANIAGIVTTKCYGVVGMASRNRTDGLVSLLKKEAINKGIKVVIDDSNISINLHIIVEYGVNISAICENIIKDVKYHVELMTGFNVDRINVNVESVRVD